MVRRLVQRKIKTVLRLIPVYGAVIVLLAGCGTSTNATATKTFHSTTKSGLEVSLALSPTPPVARQETKVSVSLTKPGVTSFQNYKVWINESMPSMSMPVMKQTLRATGAHTFSGKTLFVMGGKWRVEVHVQIGTTEDAKAFNFKVKQ